MAQYVYNSSAKIAARVRAIRPEPGCPWYRCNGQHLDLELLNGEQFHDGACPLFWKRVTKREAMGASIPDFTDPAHWRYQCAVNPNHTQDVELVIWAKALKGV